MIKGIGVDVVEIERIQHAMQNPRFFRRVLTEREINSREWTAESLAGIWAAKEAIAKAVNSDLHWHDVEITHTNEGAPIAKIDKIVGQIFISITHEKTLAIATALWQELR